MNYDGIDTAARITPETAQKLRENGFSFVARYLVPEEGMTKWKALSASEAQDIRAAGLALMLVWETASERVKVGAAAGAEDGVKAKKLAEAMKIPAGTAIYFAADYNVPDADLSVAEAYFRAARIACSKYPAGVYGGEKIITHMAAKGFARLWQCVAWTNTFVAPVIQYEWQYGENAKALTEKIGVAVDLDSAETLSGMWMPYTEYADGDGTVVEYEDAMKWARSFKLVTDDMKDVSRFAVMLRRYHNVFSAAEDDKKYSGLNERE